MKKKPKPKEDPGCPKYKHAMCMATQSPNGCTIVRHCDVEAAYCKRGEAAKP